jgi:hypothetical protein
MRHLCIHLNTGLFYTRDGTITMTWVNDRGAPQKVRRVLLWGGMTIGSVMDFAESLYVTGVGNMVDVEEREVDWFPLAISAPDRYGSSNGQPYERWIDWDEYDIVIQPGQKLILQAWCADHAGNMVFPQSTQGMNQGHAQAWIWMGEGP